jgi:ribosome-associated translation inhibitor RaiA
MQIRVDVDDHIDGSEELMVRVEGVVEGSLDRYQEQLVRVEVHLSQLSRQNAGARDMCCRMEAFASAGLKPIAVSHEGMTMTEAIHAASAKLERAVATALARRSRPRDLPASGEDEGPGTEGLGHVKV